MSILDKDLTQTAVPKPHKLTEEQQAIVDSNSPLLKVVAYAGTGKTSTLVSYAEQRSDRRCLYLAFNKSVETEAKQRFGENTIARTVHALAYSRVGKYYKKVQGNIKSWQVAKELRVPLYEASIIRLSLENWLNSADAEPTEEHVAVDELNKLSEGYAAGVVDTVRGIHEAVEAEQTRNIPMTHNHYLKLFQLQEPQLDTDIVLLDEAQDTNPVTLALVLDQHKKYGTDVVMVGDPYQQIYAWRGAIDAMQTVEAPELRLTTSWRFGPAIAGVANTILSKMFGETVPLHGMREGDEVLDKVDGARTVICRTNAQVFLEAVGAADRKQPIFVVGREAFDLMLSDIFDIFHLFSNQRSKVQSRALSFHKDFEDLEKTAEDSLDHELLRKVRLVREYKSSIPSMIMSVKDHLRPLPGSAERHLVTAHKAKGLEWDNVCLAPDFPCLFTEAGKLKTLTKDAKLAFRSETHIKTDEVNLFYVVATRAKQRLTLDHNLRRLSKYEND